MNTVHSSKLKSLCFFDECGIKHQYEPITFGDGTQGYKPDFYLPDFDAYVEAKGKWPGYEETILKAISFVGDEIKILIFISEIPDMGRRGWPHFPVAYNSGVLGIQMGWWFFQDGCDPHISAARYPGPLIFPHANKVESIDPVSDWILRRCRYEGDLRDMLRRHLTNKDIEFLTQQEAREQWANEEDHYPFDNFDDFYREMYCDIGELCNPRTIKAFKKARAERFDEWLDKKRTRP